MQSTPRSASATPIVRAAVGGGLMGLANLVPGISGGTMLLACGIYTRLIRAVADLATLRFRADGLLLIGAVAAAAVAAIVLTAGTVRDLVLDHRWVMYSIFIGLTLGGLPLLLARARPVSRGFAVALIVGVLVMAALAVGQFRGTGESSASAATWLGLLLGGFLGGAAMILPGISGGYVLLLMGLYLPILTGIDDFKLAIRAGDAAAMGQIALMVLLPVLIGVLVGIGLVSGLLRYLLERCEKAVLGALSGLLVGSVLGLWPYQAPVAPQVGDVIKGQVVTEDRLPSIAKKDYPTRFFTPGFTHIAGGVGLVAAGFAVTWLLGRLNPETPTAAQATTGPAAIGS